MLIVQAQRLIYIYIKITSHLRIKTITISFGLI